MKLTWKPEVLGGEPAACFRFQRLTGYCHIQMFMLDFSLEPSEDCVKDYILFGGRWRYCGESLLATSSKWVQGTWKTRMVLSQWTRHMPRAGPWLLLNRRMIWHSPLRFHSYLPFCYVSCNKVRNCHICWHMLRVGEVRALKAVFGHKREV
jgi:hypothetical protein